MREVDQSSKVGEASKTLRDQAKAFEQASRRTRGECRRLLGKALGRLSVTRLDGAKPATYRGDDVADQGCGRGYRNRYDSYLHASLDDPDELVCCSIGEWLE